MFRRLLTQKIVGYRSDNAKMKNGITNTVLDRKFSLETIQWGKFRFVQI